MANSHIFYRMLIERPHGQNPYWDSLAVITKATRMQMNALASDLSWQTWGTEVKSAEV